MSASIAYVSTSTLALAKSIKLSKDSKQPIIGLEREEQRAHLAQRLLLATKWMVESKQKQGRVITERFRVIFALIKHWEEPFFEYGRYHVR